MKFPNTRNETVQFLLGLAERASKGDTVLTSAAYTPPLQSRFNPFVQPGVLSLVFAELIPADAVQSRQAEAVWERWAGARAFPRDPASPSFDSKRYMKS